MWHGTTKSKIGAERRATRTLFHNTVNKIINYIIIVY